MHLTYVDEVKYLKETEPYYWLCGLAFPENSIKSLEDRLSKISQAYFGSAILCKETEFHAIDIVHGKGRYKGHELKQRLELYKSLLDALEETEELKKIEIILLRSFRVVGINY